MRTSRVQELTLGALACALVAVFAFLPGISIGPIPLVGQNLAVMLIGLLFPRRSVLMGMVAFVLLVAVGAPVLTGAKGGFAILIGPTGGYIVGWVVAAYLMAWAVERFGRSPWVCLAAAALFGVGVDYLVGVPWMKVVLGVPWGKALAIGMYPFILPDLIKAVIATALALAILRALYGGARTRSARV